jgi:hypothetical protein
MNRPERCPLCDGEWRESGAGNEWFHCSNKCRMELKDYPSSSRPFYLRKILSDGTEVWWEWDDTCDVRFNNFGFQKLTFIVPFGIESAQRLRVLMTFS